MWEEIKKYIDGTREINNEMLIKFMYQLLIPSTLLFIYLTRKGIIENDYEKFVKENGKPVAHILEQEAEDFIKSKLEVKGE